MRLKGFRITDFRTITDSGWVDVDDVTALVGENESGKTNILLPLWKLNPASEDGAINLLDDFPRDRYNEARAMKPENLPLFIHADFSLPDDLVREISEKTGAPKDEVSIARVQRKYNGAYYVSFPEAKGADKVAGSSLASVFNSVRTNVVAAEAPKANYEQAKSKLQEFLAERAAEAERIEFLTAEQLTSTLETIRAAAPQNVAKGSQLVRVYSQLETQVGALLEQVSKQHPNAVKEARDAVMRELPYFVYYSTYGNLDSEIYLPHVIENMKRLANKENLGQRENAKARTLKVLFEFVKLSPQDVWELGRPVQRFQNHAPSQEEIEEAARRTREREVLMTSASTDLTKRFREWWKQGTYKFRFQADGDHFRIWVSDELRPAEVELEARSSGLQWFFSFFLVFLVERSDEHRNAILLLDEPGMSLHPLAQRDLTRFFESLALENQLLYTSHSPFLLDYDRLDEVKVVFIGENGETDISADLRASEKDPARTKSIYAVFAALGLSTADTLLIGAAPVIVEGTTDQWYLSYAKTRLIHGGFITPAREIVFLPAGGAKGIATVAAILSVEGVLPPVVIDSDAPGSRAYEALKSNLYNGSEARLSRVGDFAPVKDAEVEDLMPGKVLAFVATRLYPTQTEDFSNAYDASKPFVPQLEQFAQKHAIKLPPYWKIDLAKAAVQRMRNQPEEVDDAALDRWKKLFKVLVEQTNSRTAMLG